MALGITVLFLVGAEGERQSWLSRAMRLHSALVDVLRLRGVSERVEVGGILKAHRSALDHAVNSFLGNTC